MKPLLALADLWLSDFYAYRRWRGGKWVFRIMRDYGGWSSNISMWLRVGDGEFAEVEDDER